MPGEPTDDPITFSETTQPQGISIPPGALPKYILWALGIGSAGVVGKGSIDILGMQALHRDVAALERKIEALEDEIDASIAREHADRIGLATVVDDVKQLKANVFQLCLKAGASCQQ